MPKLNLRSRTSRVFHLPMRGTLGSLGSMLVCFVLVQFGWAQSGRAADDLRTNTDRNSGRSSDRNSYQNNHWSAAWDAGARIPLEGRANIYRLEPKVWQDIQKRGRLHTLNYPVDTTRFTLPYVAFERFFAGEPSQPLRRWIQRAFKSTIGFQSVDDFEAWLGLQPFPVYYGPNLKVTEIPPMLIGVTSSMNTGAPQQTSLRAGSSLLETSLGLGLTYGCATCHSSSLFGKTILGLQQRFPRANDLFEFGRRAAVALPMGLLSRELQTDPGEARMLRRLQRASKQVGGVSPIVEGLDTSLAHVALSLSKRNQDAYATRSLLHEALPRHDRLRFVPADSKPGNWWVLKYKNRWLLDGSVVSGNPILTNILWNEIGRGADLRKLEAWAESNTDIVGELTTAIFALEAPRYTAFFPASSIDLASAKRGEPIFNDHCAHCHGTYSKAWSRVSSSHNPTELSDVDQAELMRTLSVSYHEDTPVVDVGTDPLRHQGMRSLTQLNDLALSQTWGAKIQVQSGYVPPPLNGIWARWPYFHNNSAPSLCAVLTRAEERPTTYFAGMPVDRERDFDQECNGYPLGGKAPDAWRTHRGRFYDTNRLGMSNRGHDEGIFLRNGKELLTPSNKRDLISFLKTL